MPIIHPQPSSTKDLNSSHEMGFFPTEVAAIFFRNVFKSSIARRVSSSREAGSILLADRERESPAFVFALDARLVDPKVRYIPRPIGQ
jgi:hypothetical protein